MNGLPLDHVAIAVPDLARAVRLHQRVSGASGSPPVETLPAQGVRLAFVGDVELIEPLAPDTAVGRFLARHGPGLHHVAYRTSNLAAEVGRLAADGFQMVAPGVRPGARGHRVAFLDPRDLEGVLVELVEITRP
jgi:methylmalonyl-CoA/ethylmalonyl-CoA epimerase